MLLLGRDAHGIDRKLQSHLIDQGVKLTLQEATDYRSLMEVAEFDMSPTATIAYSLKWLADEPRIEILRDANFRLHQVATSATFDEGGTSHHGAAYVNRHTARADCRNHRGAAAVSHSGTSLITVNAGALRRTGPNRLSTAVARRAAAVVGMSSARFDLPGLGDSDGNYVQRTERRVEDEEPSVRLISTIMNHLETGPDAIGPRFVSCGLCSAAYWPMRAALTDHRLVECILINLTNFRWTPKDAERARLPYPDSQQATEGALAARKGERSGSNRRDLDQDWLVTSLEGQVPCGTGRRAPRV